MDVTIYSKVTWSSHVITSTVCKKPHKMADLELKSKFWSLEIHRRVYFVLLQVWTYLTDLFCGNIDSDYFPWCISEMSCVAMDTMIVAPGYGLSYHGNKNGTMEPTQCYSPWGLTNFHSLIFQWYSLSRHNMSDCFLGICSRHHHVALYMPDGLGSMECQVYI